MVQKDLILIFQIEDKSIDNFNKRNIIDGKSIHFHDQGNVMRVRS